MVDEIAKGLGIEPKVAERIIEKVSEIIEEHQNVEPRPRRRSTRRRMFDSENVVDLAEWRAGRRG
jgi:hypothetical protein